MLNETDAMRKWDWFSRLRKAQVDAGRSAEADADAVIGADAPIRSARQDRLRRVDYADRIATVVSALSPDHGRVFAIRGGWGFGKSSLKHLVIERLEADARRADHLDFNPWQWGDGDAIARALFGEIANSLGGTYSEGAAKRAAKLRGYGTALTGTADAVAAGGKGTGFVSAVLTSAAVVAVSSAVGFSLPSVARAAAVLAATAFLLTTIGRVLSHFGRDRTHEPLDRIRRSLETSLRHLDRPLVVFVDDIDRLEPEQIRGLVRQVKANADLPNIVFVLIYQPSIVEAALNEVADGDGRAFLEKVVQASFDLPAVPIATVHRVFTEELSALASVHATEENGFEQVRWGNALIGCIQPYLRNLRDARRLLSSVAVHLPLQIEGGTFEVNVIDFLVLEAVRVFEPRLHAALFDRQDLVLQARRFRGDGREGPERESIADLLNVVPEERRDLARDVVKELFPQVQWAFGGTTYGSDFAQRWLSRKRVNTARFLPRYFELQTPEGEVSESRFAALLAASSDAADLASAIGDIERLGMLPSLVQRFDESVDRLPTGNASILLPAMFDVAQKMVGTRSGDPFSSAWVAAWRAISWFLPRIDAAARGALAIAALKATEALSVGAIVIHLNDTTDRNEEEGGRFDPSLDPATVLAMKAEWLLIMRTLAQDVDRLLGHADVVSLLYRWRDYAGSMEEPRAWTAGAVVDDGRFAKLVVGMMSRGTTSGWGDRVAAPYDTFDRDVVDELVGVDVARGRLEAVNGDGFGEAESHAMDVLRRHIARWDEGKHDD